MSRNPDVIVVGSGASAVHAAWPLVHAGLQVLMLDVGSRDDHYAPMIPDAPFTTIRRTDPNQHRYFLGDQFEGVPFGGVRVGAQLTPPRAFINRRVHDLTPVITNGFLGFESLALGGLAAGWGSGVARFSDADLARTPLKASDLLAHYRAVESRVGVSADDDDLSPVLGHHEDAMPALRLDTGSRLLLERYQRKRTALVQRGFRMGISRLAACSQQFQGRGPHRYDDMDFWADKARAVYRPRWTVEHLSRQPNFTYLVGRLVLSFREDRSTVEVVCRHIDGVAEEFRASALILAAGVFGTARIVLRSLGLYDHPIGFVCNPSSYAACLNLNSIGRADTDERHSLSQLTAVFTPQAASADPELFAAIYSYRSLLTFKLMKESPMGVRSSLRLMRSLIPLLTLASPQHADFPTNAKTITLIRDSRGASDRLRVEYTLSAQEVARIRRGERSLLGCLRRIGCIPLRRVVLGNGSSIHYAGTFPMSATPRELTTSPDGLLCPTRSVFLADGSLLPDLPCKAPTLTFMAGADRIGTLLARRLT